MVNEERALTVQIEGTPALAEDPQEAQERRLREVCSVCCAHVTTDSTESEFTEAPRSRQRNMMQSSGTSWTPCQSRSSIFKGVVLGLVVENSTSTARCAHMRGTPDLALKSDVPLIFENCTLGICRQEPRSRSEWRRLRRSGKKSNPGCLPRCE